MRRRLKRLGRGERGQAVVELALLLLLLLLLAAGAVDVGRSMHSWIVIQNAAREGARYGSRYPWDYDGVIAATIEEAALSNVVLTEGNITIVKGFEGESGDPFRVAVVYDVDTLLLGALGGPNPLMLGAAAEMIVFGLDEPGT